MSGAVLLAAAAEAPAQGGAPAAGELHVGMLITRSVKVAPRTYRLGADLLRDSGVIVIRGNDITVDFAGATLEGTPAPTDPDLAAGICILVDGGRNVRIVNARIRGYKIGILARGTVNLTVEKVDASNNWKPRLFSLMEHESLVDWLSFHHNENQEWLRFGSAFYFDGVRGGSVRNSRAEQGMNALLMVRTSGVTVAENDFSFNSGLGIGLYRSSGNTIVRNRVDFNVRGYSHGFYRRGQDSAGILLYEQSSDNVIAFNTGTHGGDGFFLWAGQSTMDSGEGGANDNWVVGNDFSWAPANGIEATFSRNAFVGNRLEGSDYGIWGGYSYSSRAIGNCFLNNRIGVAVEHGQDNSIVQNTFYGDTTAVSIWASSPAPTDWGYARVRDTQSRDYRIAGNAFSRNRVVLRGANTAGITFRDNVITGSDSIAVLRDTARYTAAGNGPGQGGAPAASGRRPAPPGECQAPPFTDSVPAAIRAKAANAAGGTTARLAAMAVPLQPMARRDRSAIVVDEWGPYDWRSPKLWPVDSTRSLPLRLRVLGPNGRWRLISRRGVAALSREAGSVGDTIVVTPHADSTGDWAIDLEFIGAATRTPLGVGYGPGVRYRFGYERFEPPQRWDVRFHAWTDSTAPDLAGAAAERALRGPVALRRTESRLDYFWYRPTMEGLPRGRWAMEAEAAVDLAPGTYTVRTISDDGIRVWVDDRLAIDRWTHHESAVDHAPLSGGHHRIRVQYFQDDGWAELRLDILRGVVRSPGSPGPH
ncbi:MAG: right-handed parallel beta-helix repeat-containing protein [Gemmatimonadaceae bacterium]|nr:right-handed parallel beta-helix repeat-containing protein [Gemmatimonadaceae bacterium]